LLLDFGKRRRGDLSEKDGKTPGPIRKKLTTKRKREGDKTSRQREMRYGNPKGCNRPAEKKSGRLTCPLVKKEGKRKELKKRNEERECRGRLNGGQNIL